MTFCKRQENSAYPISVVASVMLYFFKVIWTKTSTYAQVWMWLFNNQIFSKLSLYRIFEVFSLKKSPLAFFKLLKTHAQFIGDDSPEITIKESN